MCLSEGYPYSKAVPERFHDATSLMLLAYLGKACPPHALHAVQMYSPIVADLCGMGVCVQVGTSTCKALVCLSTRCNNKVSLKLCS